MFDFSHQAMSHARRLCVDIGHRPAGSPENTAAAHYIEDIFSRSGLQVERQLFDSSNWQYHETRIEVGDETFDGQANWHSPACDVKGEIVPLWTVDDLEKADLSGKIALCCGDLTGDEMMPRSSVVYYPEQSARLNRALDEKKPLGVITINPFLHGMRHVIKDPLMEIPSATVSPQVGLKLIQRAGDDLRLKIDANRSEASSWNVLGHRTGVRPERVVISAHFDTVWGTPGAVDNTSGTSVLLALAQALADRPLPVSLEFYAANAEEFGGQGTVAYLNKYGLREIPFNWEHPIGEHSPVWEPILANINMDGVGLALATNTVMTVAGSNAFSGMVEQIRGQKYGQVKLVDPWPASDHYTFFSHGVPCIAFSSTGGLTNYQHTPIDTIEWVSAEKLAEVGLFVLDLLDQLADKTSAWCRPE